VSVFYLLRNLILSEKKQYQTAWSVLLGRKNMNLGPLIFNSKGKKMVKPGCYIAEAHGRGEEIKFL